MRVRRKKRVSVGLHVIGQARGRVELAERKMCWSGGMRKESVYSK